MIVMKFGGTSVADRGAIERLIAIVRSARQAAIQPEAPDWRGPVVVVSALGGATDKFLSVASDAGAGNAATALETLRQLRARHLEVAGIIGDTPARAEVDAFINAEFDDLERLAGALSVLHEVTPRWLDAIAAAPFPARFPATIRRVLQPSDNAVGNRYVRSRTSSTGRPRRRRRRAGCHRHHRHRGQHRGVLAAQHVIFSASGRRFRRPGCLPQPTLQRSPDSASGSSAQHISPQITQHGEHRP